MPDTPDTHDLESFAIALADELPGTWRSAYHQHTDYPEQFSHAEAVWDMNLVSGAVAAMVLGQDAVLTRDDGTRLYVIGRPGAEEEFLVAAMAPPAIIPEAFRGVREPDGIAVPDDPSRAAENIAVDLLPRYDRALAQVQHNAAHPPPVPARAVQEQVTLTWFGDGMLAAKPESQKAAAVLHSNGFAWDPAEKAFVLSGDDTTRQAQAAQAVSAQLTALDIGTVIRHPPNRLAPTSAAPAAQPQRTTAPRTR
ncbi:hypothetical protein [Streptomyces sp. NPDC014894]|uniref:hypothetical protein n=1 Tax=Streptomyces sp. NPDC014894 TaxID=3364931 RepID=UPI003702873C